MVNAIPQWPVFWQTWPYAEIRFRGRYWGKSGHGLLQRICLLLTQSGHQPAPGALQVGAPTMMRPFRSSAGGAYGSSEMIFVNSSGVQARTVRRSAVPNCYRN